MENDQELLQIKFRQSVKLEHVASYSDHSGIIWCVAWDWTGSRLASCGADKIVRIWNFSNGQLHLCDKLSEAHAKTIRSVAFSPDGKRLAVASFDGTVSVWRDSNGSGWKCVANLEGHENEVKSVAWSPDGRLLASCGRDKTVWIWDSSLDDDEFECVAVLADHTQDVKQLKWHPNDLVLASASYDESVRLWTSDMEEDDWFATSSLVGHTSTVWSIDFCPTGNYFISGSDDNCLVLWRRIFGPKRLPIKYEPIQRLWNAHRRTIYSVSWFQGSPFDEFDEGHDGWPEHMFVATASGDRSIGIWTAKCATQDADGTPIRLTLGEFHLATRVDPAHNTEVNCVAWNPRSPFLASCDDDGLIKLWKLSHA